MTTMHSKETVILVNGTDISAFCTDSNAKRSAKTEDNTTYGKDDEVYDPTLLSGTFGCGGKYHTKATSNSPKSILEPLVGTKVPILYRPEGTGSGLPQNSFDAVITGYEETAPIAGYRLWTLETQPSDAWDNTNQA